MKKLMLELLKIYGIGTVCGSAVVLLITLLVSTQSPGFAVRVVTNNYYECYPEIVVLIGGLFAYVYTINVPIGRRNRK